MQLPFLDITNECVSNNFIIYRIHYSKRIDKFFKLIIHIDNLFKHFLFPLLCKYSEWSIVTLLLVHTVPQQSPTSLSAFSVLYVNNFVRQFELFIHVFGHCRCQFWGLVFLFSKVFCCNNQLIPQSHKLVEICLSHCKILYKSETFVVIFLENFELCIQEIGNILDQKNHPNLFWHFLKFT